MANSVDVAREFINLAKEDGNRLNNLQLQKLVYIAHGIHLAKSGQPLLDQEVNAWKNGPIIPDVYNAFSKYLNNIIDDCEGCVVKNLYIYEKESIKDTYLNFGKFDGTTLKYVTSREGSPWDKVWNVDKTARTNTVIPNSIVKQHYDIILKTKEGHIL